jgi:hypothetical protein
MKGMKGLDKEIIPVQGNPSLGCVHNVQRDDEGALQLESTSMIIDDDDCMTLREGV